MGRAVPVVLPGGRWVDGERRTDAMVRPLLGDDEVVLIDETVGRPRPEVATSILSWCVGFPDSSNGEEIRRLTVGDREALLWHIRRFTVGEHIDATVTCAACHEKVSIELQVSDLLHDPYPDWPPSYIESIGGHTVEFRLPTGADQEALTIGHHRDPAEAVGALLAACVVAVDGGEPNPENLVAVGDGVSARMEALDPQAEAMLETTCPSCGSPVVTALDATAFLAEEVDRRGRYVLSEVHVLASTYGWSERDILAMSSDRRRAYLDLIDGHRSGSRR